jgi:hypothetical protein
MFAKHLPTRHAFARLLTIASACALPAAAAPVALAASARPVARMAISAPTTHAVSGSIRFSARHVPHGARKVIFKIDGSHTWTARRAPYRFHRTGVLNTRRLRNGTHLLSVEAIFTHHHVRVAHRRVVVSNHPIKKPAVKKTQPAGALNVGVALPPAGGVRGAPVAVFDRETFAYSSALSTAAEANRYQVIVLEYPDAARAAALKAANPNLKILLYQDIMLSRPTDTLGWATCTSYANDQATHPEWFLHDQNGNLVNDKPYPGNVFMDVGNPAYQQACLSHTIAQAQKYGFDGLYLDDVTTNPAVAYYPGTVASLYPTPAAWQSAMSSMITAAAAASHAAGFMVLGNIGGAYNAPGIWQQWNTQLDGAEEQAWNDPSLPLSEQIREWPIKLAEAVWSEAHGKYLLAGSYNTTETGNTFGLATMMLAANGKTSYSVSNANQTSSEGWYAEYDTAQRLGAPAGPYRQLANGVYERVFSNGIVLVNPTRKPTSAFSLGGAQFSGSGLNTATTAAMAPMSGLILARVG